MKIQKNDHFFLGTPEEVTLSPADRSRLEALANEEYADELAEMLDESQSLASPCVLFGACHVSKADDETVLVNQIPVPSPLVFEKLNERNRCFPYICTCGTALETWSEQYAGDVLAEYWADEIKKYYVGRVTAAFYAFLKEEYHVSGHLTSLNPGSISAWPLSGQHDLFEVLGGKDYVKEQIGVTYTPSFLMLPSKSVSGIAFESEVFFENCQYCPLDTCPNRRAPRILT